MRYFSRCNLVFLLFLMPMLLGGSPAVAEKQSWLPLSSQDKEIKEVPGNPGADAIQLYYSKIIDDNDENNEAEYVYKRIKVLNEKGNKYADVEIVVPGGFKLADLRARTIHPDGKIVDFTGKPFDKVIAKGKGIKYSGKSFTLPEVTPGSIVEYMYKLEYPPNELPAHEWDVQDDLYTVKESFKIHTYTGQLLGVEGGTGISVSYNLPKGVQPRSKGDSFELQMENVPAFSPEPYMPPEQVYRYHVTFFYGGKEVSSAENFWRTIARRWADTADSFIGNRKELREAAAQAIGDEKDHEAQLKKLYARAQQVRNLTYERERSAAEQKKENLKNNENSADVLGRGYGDREDITYVFVGLARAAGFPAWPVKTGNRAEQIFQKNVLDPRQLEGEVALVVLDGKEIFLDPGTPFCPFGLVRWIRNSAEGLKLDRSNPQFVLVPGAGPEKAGTVRAAQVTLSPEGVLKGEVAVAFNGIEAMERRLDALDSDEAGRKKSLEDEIRGWLPEGTSVTLKQAGPWDSGEQRLVARFDVQVNGYGSIAGKRMVVPVDLFRTEHKEAFAHEQRRFPVYFEYARTEVDRVNIVVPAGFTVEAVPTVQNAALPYAAYQASVKFQGGQIMTERSLQLNIVSCPVEKYSELKGFFAKVQAGDEQQAVFQGGSISAQKGE